MCQTNNCNDYSQITANTGLGTVALANPNLNGTGNVALVLSAGANGTTIKSITIKSVPPASGNLSFSQQGMVRLYIQDDAMTPATILYKEVPIPAQPMTNAMPLPIPAYTTFETVLVGDLKLQPGYKLIASTQVANTFNVIAEGVDWEYPDPIPDVCCNFVQEVAVTGVAVISAANPDYDGTGAVNIFTAGTTATSNGSTVKSITIKAQQSTHEGTVRIFISPDGSNYLLMREVFIPLTEQSAYVPSFKQVIEMDFDMQSGYVLAATTQNAEGFAITVEAVDWLYP